MSLNNKKSGASDYLNGFIMTPRESQSAAITDTDYIQDMYLHRLSKMTDSTKNLITAANVGVFSLTFVAMFVSSVAEYANKISSKVAKIVAPDTFYCALLYITAMMSKLAPKYGRWISGGLLALFGFVMIRKSNGFKMLRPSEPANYWYLGAASFALLYAYKQTTAEASKDNKSLGSRILYMASNFNSVMVIVLLFLGSKNYNFGVRSGGGGLFYGGSLTPPSHAF